MTTLTERRREFLVAIADYWREQGFAPTVRDLQQRFELGSPNGVVCNLIPLAALGLVTWRDGMARTIRLTDKGHEAINATIQQCAGPAEAASDRGDLAD